jgi:epoxyqueuosine reductase
MTMPDELRNFLQSNGADVIGFADLSDIASDVRDNFRYGISMAVALNPRIISEIKDGPTKQYYGEYERANGLLDALGHKAKWFAATRAGIDRETLATRLPHKTAATRAGLGWIGKCAVLVTRGFGSAVRITTVLTDVELPAGEPIDESYCGNCTECVDACPGHAPSGKDWQVGIYRDSFFDAFACRTTARELALKRAGIRETICGICIAVCPWTQKYVTKESTPD